MLMIADVPFALFVGTAVYLRAHSVPAFLSRRPFAIEGLLFAPAGLSIFLLIVSFLISYRNPLWGLSAGLATFALFAQNRSPRRARRHRMIDGDQ